MSGACPAGNSSVFVGEGIGVGGALSHTESIVYNIRSTAVAAELSWKLSESEIDKREAVNGDR